MGGMTTPISTSLKMGLALVLVLSLAACAQRGTRSTDVGLPFASDLDRGEDRRDFTVVVEALGASLEDARESARYPATRHCIDLLGNSVIEWNLDPATGDWAVQRTEDGDLIVSGRCAMR